MAWNETIEFLEKHLLPCSIKSLTGLDCPGCGMQRALLALLRGDLTECLKLNPALPVYLLALFYTGAHLSFKFRNGARNVLVLFCIAVSLMIVNFIVKLGFTQ